MTAERQPTEVGPGFRTDLAVVLCTFNGGAFVAEQVQSILRQTVLPATIHVYDDGSSDGTVEVVQGVFADRSAAAAEVELRIHPTGTTRYGAAGNFMRGLEETNTDLVALADQDDVWHPRRLESTVRVLDEEPDVLLVASNATFIDGNGRSLGRTTLEAQLLTRDEAGALRGQGALAVLTRRNVVPGMTFTVRRRLVDQLQALPAGVMHDYRLALRAAAQDGLVVLTTPLVDYRIHGANAIGLDAGNRGLMARFRARWRLVRTPLTDLAQWTELVGSLRRSDPSGHLPLVEDKLRFERRRRFAGMRGPARVLALLGLIRSGDYRRFDVGGWRGAVKDFLRPAATDLPTEAE